MKLNRNARAASATVVLSLCVTCLMLSLPTQAQTYTQNDIYTIAGGGSVATTAVTADLPGPTSAIMDSAGNIYIAAPLSAYVFKMTSTGAFSVFAGKGFGGFGGEGLKVSLSTLTAVAGLTIDSKGNIYIADTAGSRLRVVNMGTTNLVLAGVTIKPGTIATVAGNGTKCDHSGKCGDGGKATLANLNLPESIVLDPQGNIYIADSADNRIRVVNVGSTSVTLYGVTILGGNIGAVAGTGVACTNPQGNPACGDGTVASTATLNSPYGVALDSKLNLYIADTLDQRIRIVAPSTGIITTFAGNGIGCTNPVSGCGDGLAATSAEVRQPRGVATDPANDVYIADTLNNRIREVANGQNLIKTVVDTSGKEGFAGDLGSNASALINLPQSVLVDASGNLLISDSGNQRIRYANLGASSITIGGVTIPAGQINTIAGGGNGGDGGLPTAALLALPWHVAEDAQGNLYIVDQGNNRVRKITNPGQSTAVISTFAGNGIVGSCSGTPAVCTGDGGPAASASLNAPSSIAFDSHGNAFIADSGNIVIREVSSTGTISTPFGNGGFCFPTTSACGDAGPPTGASFDLPLTVAVDINNNVYVSDWQGNRIREWNTTTNVVSTVAGTGVAGRSGDGGPATSANLNHPAGLVIDNVGNEYISDQYNGVMRQVCNSSSGTNCLALSKQGDIYTWALNGQAKLAGDGGTKLSGSMWNPLMLAISPAQDVYISGGNDNTVQRVSMVTGIYSTVAGNPTNAIKGGFSGDKGPAINARMANLGAMIDGQSNLFIADGGNNRVRYVPLAPGISLSNTTLNLGQWALGSTGSQVPDTITGAGGLDLSLTSFTVTGPNSGDVGVVNNCGTLPALVSPEASCNIDLTLTPSVYGPESATLNINDNVTGSPQLVTLTGSGPNFTTSVSPTSLTVTAGSAGTATASLAPQAKFNQPITMSCSGLPASTTCAYNPNPVPMPGGSTQTSALTIQTSSTTPKGTYTVQITGTFGTLVNSTPLTLTVQ